MLALASALLRLALGPTGRVLGLALMAGGALAGAWWNGHAAARRACDAASLRAELAAARADLAIAAEAARAAHRTAERLEAQARDHADALRRLEAARASLPADRRCPLSRGDARRLQSLR